MIFMWFSKVAIFRVRFFCCRISQAEEGLGVERLSERDAFSGLISCTRTILLEYGSISRVGWRCEMGVLARIGALSLGTHSSVDCAL